MTTTLPLFWHLSSASKKDRIDASVKLISALEQFQSEFAQAKPLDTSDEEDGHVPKSDDLENLNAHDVSYAIRRLVRGLASPRESSRLGFAVALTELLSRLNTVSCSQVLSLVVDSSKIQGSMNGQEERDVLFARLFGLTAIIQSGLMLQTESTPDSSSVAIASAGAAGYREILSELAALGEKKSWLRESAWWTICLALNALSDCDIAWKEDALNATLQFVFVENRNWTSEKVALALKLQGLRPENNWKKLLSPTFKNADLLSAANLHILAQILKESTLVEDEEKTAAKAIAGAWKPQVHFVWDVLLDCLLPGVNSQHPPRGSFRDFFRVVVDETLFSSTSSPQRKYWGFQVFQKALSRITEDQMPMLFTKNFMRSWINHLASNDRYLHNAAKSVAAYLQNSVQKNPQMGFALVLQLTGVNGSRNFDRLTKSKTVESTLASMDAEGIQSYVEFLLKQVDLTEGEAAEAEAIDSRRLWIIDQLAALVRNGSIPKEDKWVQSILEWFIVNGLFVFRKKKSGSQRSKFTAPAPAFSEDLQKACRDRLLCCLADLIARTSSAKLGDRKILKASGTASDGESWIAKVMATARQLRSDSVNFKALVKIEDDILKRSEKTIEKLRKVASDQVDSAKGAELLIQSALLHLHCAIEAEELDLGPLESCIEGATRLLLDSKTLKLAAESAEMPAPVDVLVDVIIGLFEDSTTFGRSVGNQALSLLSGRVKESTIDLILTQLESRNTDEIDDASGEDGEDVESVDEEEESDTKDEENGSSSDFGDSEDVNIDPELREKVKEALQVNTAMNMDGSDEESDTPMDDEQMLAVDEQLADIFRTRSTGKRGEKDNTGIQRKATQFKIRVLDLIDTFARKQSSSPLILRLVLPLLDLVTGSGSSELQLLEKATGILRSRIISLKEVPDEVDTDIVAQVLEEVHLRARKARLAKSLGTLSQCSLYISRVLLHSNGTDYVLRTYRASVIDFVTRKNSALNAAFFQDFIRRYPTPAWSLRSDLIDLTGRAANVYRQCQVFQLLNTLINQLHSFEVEQKEVVKFMKSIRTALLEVLSSACQDSATLTAAHFKDLLKIGLSAIRSTKRVAAEKVSTIWAPEQWIELGKKLEATQRFKDSAFLRTACQQMVSQSAQVKSVKGSHEVTGKRKNDALPDVESKAAKKAKRKSKG